jgi:hypothetical protein
MISSVEIEAQPEWERSVSPPGVDVSIYRNRIVKEGPGAISRSFEPSRFTDSNRNRDRYRIEIKIYNFNQYIFVLIMCYVVCVIPWVTRR